VQRKIETEAELHAALYVQTLIIHIWKFKKIWNKILEIVNDVYYNSVECQYKLFYILGYTKMTNSDKFYSESAYFNTIKFLRFYQFRVTWNTNQFALQFYTIVVFIIDYF
jgi:hypothetical protein